MVFQCINICQVPWEVLKTAAFGLGFQHLPRNLANVNAWKTMFDPYNATLLFPYEMRKWSVLSCVNNNAQLTLSIHKICSGSIFVNWYVKSNGSISL